MITYETNMETQIMWYKLIVTFAILYILIMQLAALKPAKEQLAGDYNHKAALCKEHGGVLYSNRFSLICGDGTEIRN